MVTSEKPFFAPEKISASTSSVQTTSLVTQDSVSVPASSSTATLPVEAPGARPVIYPTTSRDVTGATLSEDLQDIVPADQSLTSMKMMLDTVTDAMAHSDVDSEAEFFSEPHSPPVGEVDEDELSDRDCTKTDDLDQEISEKANYQETMRRVKSFMG